MSDVRVGGPWYVRVGRALFPARVVAAPTWPTRADWLPPESESTHVHDGMQALIFDGSRVKCEQCGQVGTSATIIHGIVSIAWDRRDTPPPPAS